MIFTKTYNSQPFLAYLFFFKLPEYQMTMNIFVSSKLMGAKGYICKREC